jgi:hypothetical protein
METRLNSMTVCSHSFEKHIVALMELHVFNNSEIFFYSDHHVLLPHPRHHGCDVGGEMG